MVILPIIVEVNMIVIGTNKLNNCLWCDEPTASIKFGVSMPDPHMNNVLAEGYYIECSDEDCLACTLHQPTKEDAIKAWNSGDVWGYDI